MGPLDYLLVQERLRVIEPSISVLVLHTGDLDDLDGADARLERRADRSIAGVRSGTADYTRVATLLPLLRRSALATYLLRRYYRRATVQFGDQVGGREERPASVDDSVRVEIMRFVLEELHGRLPTGLIFFNHVTFRPNRDALRTEQDRHAREVFQRAVAAAGVPFLDATPGLIEAFESTG